MKIALVQVVHDPIRSHEYTSFVSKFAHEELVVEGFEVYDGLPQVDPTHFTSFDGVIIGGGPLSMVDEDAHTEQKSYLLSLVEEVVDARVPLLGVCFGHQLIAHALGGVVARNPMHSEVGVIRVYQNEAGKGDPVFASLPPVFMVRARHDDHVAVLPKGAEHLLYNQVCEHQAFRMEHGPVYGVQFHPEISLEDIVYRYTHFHDEYFLTTGERDAHLEAMVGPDPCAADVLRNFIGLVGRLRAERK